jgi:hypothetical protein
MHGLYSPSVSSRANEEQSGVYRSSSVILPEALASCGRDLAPRRPPQQASGASTRCWNASSRFNVDSGGFVRGRSSCWPRPISAASRQTPLHFATAGDARTGIARAGGIG